MVMLLFAASLPVAAKCVVLALALQGYVAQSLYKVLQLAVPAVWRWRGGLRGAAVLWPVDVPLPTARLWLGATTLGLSLSAAGAIAAWLLLPALGLSPLHLRAAFDARFAVTPLQAVLVVVFLSCANSALEELHFRAWLDRELLRRAGDATGIAVSAMVFGIMHALIVWGLPGVTPVLLCLVAIALALAGAAWSLLARCPGGIHAAWWSHALTDALLLTWGLWWLGYIG